MSLSVVAIGLLKKSISRKNVSKLRFLYDVGFAAINLLLFDEYLRLAFNTPFSVDDIGYAVKASSAIIIGCMFGGIACLLANRNVLKKVWS